MFTLFFKTVLCIGMFLLNSAVFAQIPEQKKIIQVRAIVEAPFVFIDETNQLQGLSISIFREIARQNNWLYTIVPAKEEVDTAIDDLAAGKFDILIGPISITENRIKKIAYSRPFYLAEGKLAINRQSISHKKAIVDLMESFPVGLLIIILIVLIGISHVIWLSERKTNTEMPKQYFYGLMFASWIFITHFFKGGLLYHPKTVVARLILMVWLMIALSIFLVATSTYTAYITAKVIDSRKSINNVTELFGRRIAYVAGQNYTTFPEKVGATGVKAASIQDALMLVQNKKVFAAIGSFLIIRTALNRINAPDVVISSLKISSDEVAFGTPINSPYLRPMDITIVGMQDSGLMVDICKIFLGDKYLNCEF